MRNFQILSISTLALVFGLALLISCSDDETPVDTTPKNITLTFSAEVEGNAVAYSTGKYTTSLNQQFSIDRIKVYISNVVLVNTSSSEEFVEPDSYHLVALNPDNQTFSFTVANVPAGFQFNSVRYSIGIDATKNLSTDNTGDLDPANDMAWNWNTGYKFFLMEGNYFPSDGSEARGLIIHIGTNDNLQVNEVALNSMVTVSKDASMTFKIDALSPLSGPNDIDFTDNTTFKIGDASNKMAQNYGGKLVKLEAFDF